MIPVWQTKNRRASPRVDSPKRSAKAKRNAQACSERRKDFRTWKTSLATVKTQASQTELSKPSKTQKSKRPFRFRDTRAHLVAQLADLVACLANGLHACRVMIHVSNWVGGQIALSDVPPCRVTLVTFRNASTERRAPPGAL